MSDRGVSGPLGVILLLGITAAAVTALLLTGGTVLSDTRADAERSQTENAMAQFSSKASLVSLGESGDQRFSLGRISEGEVRIDEHAGNVSVYADRTDGDRVYIGNVSMGAMVYRSGDTEIAYQGGGVWDRTDGFTRMVSPPEYHYRASTLTFPIINVTGQGTASGDVRGRVTADENGRALYPNATRDETFVNPLTNGSVHVAIESRYCRGWESFFRERSQSALEQTCTDGENDTVVVELSVSFDPVFGAAVTAERIENDGADIENYRDGIVAPSASDRIEERIDECDDGSCNGDFTGELGAGTYYTEDADDFSDLVIDTDDGDVDIIVNDDSGGIDGTDSIDVTGDGTANVYLDVEEEISLGGGDSVNAGGEPEQFITYVHSDVSAIKMTGSAHYVGGIYAPKTSMEGDQGNGNGNSGCGGGSVEVTGSVIVENFCFRNGEFNHDDDMDGIDPDVSSDTVKYLHVSENPVRIELD
jgi:hypothetical protein